MDLVQIDFVTKFFNQCQSLVQYSTSLHPSFYCTSEMIPVLIKISFFFLGLWTLVFGITFWMVLIMCCYGHILLIQISWHQLVCFWVNIILYAQVICNVGWKSYAVAAKTNKNCKIKYLLYTSINPINRSNDQSIHSIDQTIDRPTDQLTNQPTNHRSIDQPTDQPTDRPTDRSIDRSINQSINQYI